MDKNHPIPKNDIKKSMIKDKNKTHPLQPFLSTHDATIVPKPGVIIHRNRITIAVS